MCRAAREKFKSLDLEKIDSFKDDLKVLAAVRDAPNNPRGPAMAPAVPGKIYLGQLIDRDMRTGQPVHLSFKVVVEETWVEGEEGP